MSPASVSILLWSLGQLGPRLRTISVDGHTFDSFLHRIVEHAGTKCNHMTVEQLTSAITGQIVSITTMAHSISCLFSSGFALLAGSRPPKGPLLSTLCDAVQAKLDDFSKRDLLAVAFALSQLQVSKSRRLIERLCGAAENQMDEFSPYDMLSFFRSLLIPYTQLPRSFTRKGIELLESGLETLNAGQLLSYFRLSGVLSQNPSCILTIYSTCLERVCCCRQTEGTIEYIPS